MEPAPFVTYADGLTSIIGVGHTWLLFFQELEAT